MYVYMSLILIHCQCKKFFTVNKSQTSICEFQSSYDLSQTFFNDLYGFSDRYCLTLYSFIFLSAWRLEESLNLVSY